MQYLYIGFAVPAIASNVLILFILVRNVAYLKKSAFVAGLAIADNSLGIGVLVAGILRVSFIQENIYDLLIEPSYCLKHITTLLLIGIQLPAAMMFLIGSERIVAIVWYELYYHSWSNKKSWFLTSAAFLFCTASVAVAWVIVYTSPNTLKSPHHCTTPIVVGPSYAAYSYGFACACGLWAFLTTLFSLVRFIKTKQKMLTNASSNHSFNTFVKKQF